MYAPTFGFSGSCSSARATTQAVTPVPQLTTSGLPVSHAGLTEGGAQLLLVVVPAASQFRLTLRFGMT